MGIIDLIKKWKRFIDSYLIYRRSYLFLVVFLVLIVYFLPNFQVFYTQERRSDSVNAARCLDDYLIPFYLESLDGNANIRSVNDWEDENEKSYLPWSANGHIGLSILPKSSIYIRQIGAKTLTLPIGWSPLVTPAAYGPRQEAVTTHFLSGIVNSYHCYESGLYLSHQIYTHRSNKEIIVQEIKVANPTSKPIALNLDMQRRLDRQVEEVEYRVVRLKATNKENGFYNIITAPVYDSKGGIGFAAIVRNISSTLVVEPHRTTTLFIPTVICTEILNQNEFSKRKNYIVNRCIEIMKNVVNNTSNNLKQEHIYSWYKLWGTGMYISESKAIGALNGNKINATIYYVLTNIELEAFSNTYTNMTSSQIRPYTSSAEGCYGGYHHTLQAVNLWTSLRTFSEINETVSLWLLTLEKQGCHKLIKTGAAGVGQAIILSFGGFRFTGQHLEFKIDPKFLHRDYVFRRLKYDENTSINITVTLQDDNKALLGVCLDKADRTFFACDGGCNLEPVQLGNQVAYFPVKLTEPITSILYITPDKDHMGLIKDTLHVHKIVEAPAYDHHVIALHRHGHHLGGLPTFFWALICFLIIVFHLFLFKLIANEYCGRSEKQRNRYGKI